MDLSKLLYALIAFAAILVVYVIAESLLTKRQDRKYVTPSELKALTEAMKSLSNIVALPKYGPASYIKTSENIWLRFLDPFNEALVLETTITGAIKTINGPISNPVYFLDITQDTLRDGNFAWVSARDKSYTPIVGRRAGLVFKLSDRDTSRIYVIPQRGRMPEEKRSTLTSALRQIADTLEVTRFNTRGRIESDDLTRSLSEQINTIWHVIAGIRHDVNGILQPMLNDIKTMARDIDSKKVEVDQNAVDGMIKIMSSVPGAQEVIANISRIVQTLADPHHENPTTDVMNLADSFTGNFTNWLQRQEESRPNLEIIVDIPGNLAIEATSTGFYQSVWNVLRNSLKYTDDGGMIKITGDRGGDGFVYLHITDNGPGIPNDEISSIGQFGFRGSTTSSTEGHGIGLWMTRKILESMDGELLIYSELGKGTQFSLRFREYVFES